MYGYTLAAYKLGISHDLRPQLAAQPPWDKADRRLHLHPLHLRHGLRLGRPNPGKIGAWRFDKRSYSHAYPPKKIPDPPKGMNNDLVRALVDAVNEASAALPDWGKWGTENVIAGFH